MQPHTPPTITGEVVDVVEAPAQEQPNGAIEPPRRFATIALALDEEIGLGPVMLTPIQVAQLDAHMIRLDPRPCH
jgi:hypothetical protein